MGASCASAIRDGDDAVGLPSLSAIQITSGPSHHFFGYIGHCRTIPWSGDGRYLVCLETGFQDRMPTAGDPAGILLLDTHHDYAPERIAETRAWNPQQGCMLYWDPERPETRFFFNDLDPVTGAAFTVLYDIVERRRVHEYRFAGVPVANGGVAQGGGSFLAINYGRLARLRPVTGYPGASDVFTQEGAPELDGIFHVDTRTGRSRLICSYQRIREHLLGTGVLQESDPVQMFINHTLWNRQDDLVMFFARSGAAWGAGGGTHLNQTFTMRPDGSGLAAHGYIGGHPEWDEQSRIIAASADGVRLYDPATRSFAGSLGDRDVFLDPTGDKALSPDGRWLVHGDCVHKAGGQWHRYVFFRLCDGRHVSSPLFPRGLYTAGDLRLDPSPCWNRTSDRVVFPAIASDGTRQLFTIAFTAPLQ